MIAVWSNGWDGSGAELVFVEVGSSSGLRGMSHLVALLRMIDKIGAAEQGVVAVAQEVVFTPKLQPIPLVQWVREAFVDALQVREDVDQKSLDRVLAAVPDDLLAAADIWHVDGIRERIEHRKRA